MHTQTLQTVYGCLLHDFGKIVYRAGGCSGTHSKLGWQELRKVLPDPAWQPALDCLRWHHAAEIRKNPPSADHPAYIACIADNLSAAADRREIEGEGGHFIRDLPLAPVFSQMNGVHPGFSLPAQPLDGHLRMPQSSSQRIQPGRYADAQREIEALLRNTLPEQERINSLLTILEAWTGNLPSSTFSGESPDISLYDHLKTTTAIGSCISEYLLEQGERNFKKRLFEDEKYFRAEPCFLLYSADLSGIQTFIYTVAESKALRSLRSRSFFLGLLMEHYIDELLRGCGLSRANLLYSGGGHCYLLLPNTPGVVETIRSWNLRFNNFLLDQFGTVLFLGHGWTECCGNDLTNTPADQAPYRAMFRRVSGAISAHKLHRYSPAQILSLNCSGMPAGRECRICGRTNRLKDDLCLWCRTFVDLSHKIQNSDVYVVSTSSSFSPDLTLPSLDGEANFFFTDETSARSLLQSDPRILRIYTKNKSCTGLRYSTKLYVGDYAASNQMTDLADESEGIRRIAVCRMDVDNLGQSFVRGFEQSDAQDAAHRYHYVTLSRTAAFSRQISLFFQLYINDILSGAFEHRRALSVMIVYSGGDDVFLVGAWNDVLEAANRIQEDFTRFTCGSLTISGGIGLFEDHFPVRQAAARTAELEDRAKQEPGKNSLSLFDSRLPHTYSWKVYRSNVLGEKLAALERFMTAFPEYGNSLLYKLLSLIRPAQEGGSGINLARYAYQLARLEPNHNDPRHPCYREFADHMYRWIHNETDLGQLITAIYLYVYQNRGGKNVQFRK